MALQGHKALVKVAGTPITTTAEPTTTSDDKNYQITNTAKQIIAYTSTPIVYDDGVLTTEAYTVNKVDGLVTFATVDAIRGPITFDYSYVPMNQAAEAHEFSYTANAELLDKTPFLSEWLVKEQGLKSGSGSISDFDVIDNYFADSLVAGTVVVIELYPASTINPIRAFGVLATTEIAAAVAGIQDTSVSFETSEAFKIN